jgi:hypothetical protein
MLQRIVVVFLILIAPGFSAADQRFDASRELARASVLAHLSNAQTAPPGGFLPARVSVFDNLVVIEASRKTGTMLPPNTFDLGGKSILFKRLPDASYRVQVASSQINATGGAVTIAPYETRPVALKFPFPFYRGVFRAVYVHATGNLTLGKPARVPFGLPEDAIFHSVARIAPLDVWSLILQSAEVAIDSKPTQAVFTWKIRAGASLLRAQATLFKNGDIQFKYDAFPAGSTMAVTGVTPGPTSSLPPQSVDFTRVTADSFRGAIVENFNPSGGVDQVAVAKAFLSAHPDTFDMLAFFFSLKHPGRPSFPGLGVDTIYQNNISGIGRTQYNYSKVLSASGRLKAISSMFDFEAYPANPRQSFPGFAPELGRTPLELVSHEIAHYWLASVRMMENGVPNLKLLSDGCCHWSFTFDADGSFMNGNDIRDNGNGTFTTGDPLVRFSPLDQYLMGLIPPSEVGPMFYVSTSAVLPSDDARRNVTFSGVRVPVSVDQIIAAEGPRMPASTASQKSFRVAFILIVDEGRKPAQSELQKLEKLRAAWPAYFTAAASNRLTVTATLAD